MTSFFPRHKEMISSSPPRNPKHAPLASCKEAGRLLLRLLISPTKVAPAHRLKGWMIRVCLKPWSVVTIGLAMLAPSLRAEFVYVTSYGSPDISAYSIGANGALTPVPGSPFQVEGAFPVSMSVDPVDRFIYVANEGGTENPSGTVNFNGSVSAYRVAENGALTSVAGSPFAAGSFSISVASLFAKAS